MTRRPPSDKAILDQLFKEAGQLPTESNRASLCSALSNLPRWFVIDLGARDGILPLVLEDGTDPSVYLFTSGESADTLLRLHGELPESARVLSISTHEVAEFLSGLHRWGVRSATFDPGPLAAKWCLDDLIVASWLHRPESLPDIDTLAAKAHDLEPRMQMGSLWRTVRSLPCWYFVADPAIRTDPMVGICRDQPCVLTFTDPVRARRHAELIDPSVRQEGNRLMAMPPRQALWWFRSLATRGIAGAIFNDGPFAFFMPMGQMMAPVDAVRSVA
ncbi:MAG: hypothetical protein VX527_09895 [Planctomycetota bacterium]|nr:hypothetical protein [Planctomycetota bacterium]